MIHTLSYQSDELLQLNYFKLRKVINPATDIIHLQVTHSHLEDLTTNDIYKKVLQLDGRYRASTNSWTAPKVKVRVINQL